MTTPKRVVVEAERRKRSAVELDSILVLVLPDDDPDTSFLDQGDPEDQDRKEAYRRGDFSFVGVRAEAEITVDGITQTIVSGGLWGIESDSDESYIEDVALEEYDALREILKAVGVSTREVPVSDKKMIKPLIEWEA